MPGDFSTNESERVDLRPYIDSVDRIPSVRISGRVTELVGLLIKAAVPGARVGELCLIRSPQRTLSLRAEVVGFRGSEAILMPLGEVSDIAMGAEVVPTGRSLTVHVGDELLGHVLDGLGESLDGKLSTEMLAEVPVSRRPPDALKRTRVTTVLETGVRSIDGLLTVGEGQRLGIFSAAGVGKSSLLGMIARNTEADVNVVALIGERGREVRDFLEADLGEEGMKRSVIVVATSNEPSLIRMKAAYVATTIAEYFRDQGKRVMFMMDSVTRFARALREVGLAAGEPPARAGFPPSVFSELPRLLERTGNSDKGSITAFYTVLVEGDDMTEPIADETRSILDGHIVLSRTLASQNHYPAIDINESVSRVMTTVANGDHLQSAGKLREVLATYEEQKDLIYIGAYKKGSDARTDYAISKIDHVNRYLRQGMLEKATSQEAIASLKALF